ncbi:Phosphoribosylaminoimidazolecarboxamide formyltransferase [Streptomyces venezuelae]|uniref:phosphoribosylaminoimidazolecarboxamide formyltransferase n=1 Tax=Streptomyces gardneri TaxID=66892 RepID=UPI0006BE111D|nr:phosphoribosylaminoimidazolecarboxamide formyltransferase [Streptomyces gardneri]ALO06557.1 Phosphoribosylaminoimidazolecarboxamide formyltransferase [Streptomyces venezuelae]QPK43980.1 phosphoribosylaminoimidazolecarboxamide formyltransferase [Streptomyces gardneri]WRK35248.1 phosphoribosylaminoimidazolecarboxamide formyltransferase [Streptomyces venezuelae]CUM43169.1 IMP cyclohydrolase / Phosphoribosylaminoimidazolecarboxamide formyltransferase [Streptomyces venezuelae]
MELRYGINPQQLAATADPVEPGSPPIRVVNGSPSYINLLDALNSWQLVRDAGRALGRPAAASFKHVSPAGAAVAGPVDEVTAELYGVDSDGVGAVTSAYLRARDADPKSSYGDFAAVSHPVDAELAELLTRVVCDGVIAPGYAPGTVETLSRKKSGRFLVMEADETFTPPGQEAREVFGMRLAQQRDDVPLSPALLDDLVCGELTASATEDLLLGLAVLRYTQSNSVCYVRDGATLGIGAGQQSRVDCTRLAGAKTDTWWLRRHPAVRALAFRPGIRRQDRINWQIRFVEGDLTPDERERLSGALSAPAPDLTDEQRAGWLAELTGVAFASDGALPFRDNVDHARRHGVTAIAEPGGSIRSTDVEDACRAHGIALARTGLRLFHH